MILLKDKDDPRRRILLQALAAGLFSIGLAPRVGANSVLGKVPGPLPAGRSIYELRGEVKVNGVVPTIDTKIGPTDTIETGKNGFIIFVVGQDSFVVRSNSKLTLRGEKGLIDTLQLFAGKVLSVFGRSKHQIRTPSAIVGIRGTGVYTEADPDLTYMCTCYGVVDLFPTNDPDGRETIESKHHDKPRYIARNESKGKRIRPAPFINHTDEELMVLEAIVGRAPPFVFSSSDYSGPRRDY